MEIVWLGHGNCDVCTLVGGNGANLCHLAADHRVPLAFCLTTAAFDRWVDQGQDKAAFFPPDLYPLLIGVCSRLAAPCGMKEPRVAVRSSTVDEDRRIASSAGQHATYLNVAGAKAVGQAVLRCWQSAYSAHALAYRLRLRLPAACTHGRSGSANDSRRRVGGGFQRQSHDR